MADTKTLTPEEQAEIDKKKAAEKEAEDQKRLEEGKEKSKDKYAAAVKKINTNRDGEPRPKTKTGALIYDHQERVKVKISYPSSWARPKHLKQGSTVTVHPTIALNYIENGFGEFVDVVVPFTIKKEEEAK